MTEQERTNVYNIVQVESIKLAVWNIESKGYHSKEILKNSIVLLINEYKQKNDKIYLERAVDYIYAYLELGFSGEEIRSETVFAVKTMKMDAKEIAALNRRCCSRIRLNKSSIRRLIGRWNPHLHSMPISEVIDDIITKAREKQKGEYLYHCGKRLCGQEDDGIWENTYRLYISDEGALFQDVNKYKYYQLM